MSTVMRPPRRHPPQVYRRRRALALVLVALVVVALVLGVRSLFTGSGEADDAAGGTDPAAATTPTDAAPDPAPSDAAPSDAAPSEPAADESAATSETGVAACDPAAVAVAATADATAYPLGTTAKVGMTITNTGAAACSLDAGSAALELLVVSGSDRIWSSDDCQTGAESRVVDVAPGEAGMLASSVDWPLARSAAGCAEGLPELRPGTYQLTARAGEITSAPLVFEVQ